MVRRAAPGEINYPLLDRWALGHMFMGGLLSAAGASALQALGSSAIWELLEPSLKETYPRVFPVQTLDTPLNKLGDSAAWMVGYAVVEALKEDAQPGPVPSRRRKPKRSMQKYLPS